LFIVVIDLFVYYGRLPTMMDAVLTTIVDGGQDQKQNE
jgi:hypothetical protein